MSYVNIKTFEHTNADGVVAAMEVSVAFKLYSDVHRIARSHYQIFPSEKAAYSTVFEENQRDEWIAKNADMFKGVPASGG